MPKGLRDLGEDVEKKIRQALQSQLTRLDLVSREEFDVQTQVLLRTREKLALLEQRLNDPKPPGGDAGQRRAAVKTAPGARFAFGLMGGFRLTTHGDSTVHSAGKTIHDVLHPYCRQWPEDQLAGPGVHSGETPRQKSKFFIEYISLWFMRILLQRWMF